MVGGAASAWAAHRVQQRHTFTREQVIGARRPCCAVPTPACATREPLSVL